MLKVDPSKYIAPPSKVALFLVNVNDNKLKLLFKISKAPPFFL